MGGGWRSKEPQDDTQRGAGFTGKSPSEHLPSQRPLREEAGILSVQSRGQAWLALRGVAFGHGLLLSLGRPWAGVVWAAAATATAAASVLVGQQPLPLGFVVRQVA